MPKKIKKVSGISKPINWKKVPVAKWSKRVTNGGKGSHGSAGVG